MTDAFQTLTRAEVDAAPVGTIVRTTATERCELAIKIDVANRSSMGRWRTTNGMQFDFAIAQAGAVLMPTVQPAPPHPAPEPEPEPVCGNCLGHGVETCAAHPAPVSDTRREDVAREIAKTHWTTTHEGFHCVGCGWNDVGTHEDYGHAARRHVAEVALAAPTAPPVVDEAQVRERIAQVLWPYPNAFESAPPSYRDYYLEKADAVLAALPAPPVADEAEIGALLRSHHAAPADALEARMGMRNGCTCGGPGLAVDHQAAAVAAHLRGATRG